MTRESNADLIQSVQCFNKQNRAFFKKTNHPISDLQIGVYILTPTMRQLTK